MYLIQQLSTDVRLFQIFEKSSVSILHVMDESLASLYKTFRRYRDDILEDEDIREKNMAQTEIVYCVT